MDKPRVVFSESQLRSIIGSAARSDKAQYSAADVRAVGRELGISDDALNIAIANVHEMREDVVIPNSYAKARAIAATLGFFAGTSSAISLARLGPTDSSFLSIFGLAAMMLSAGMLTRSSTGKGKLRAFVEFQAKNATLWASYGVGWSVRAFVTGNAYFHRFGKEEVFILAGCAGVCAIIGGVAAFTRAPSQPMDPDTQMSSWRARLATKLKKWIDISLQQRFESARLVLASGAKR